ncbi:hypothetical protein Bca4012_040001 [Brassica carinata]
MGCYSQAVRLAATAKSECTNKPFQQRRIKKMKLVQTEKCGYGIAADEDINPGEFIIELVGEVIDDKTCKERLLKLKHKVDTNFYFCNPNTEMQKWIIDGETRVGIYAIRYITEGEYLAYDYQ